MSYVLQTITKSFPLLQTKIKENDFYFRLDSDDLTMKLVYLELFSGFDLTPTSNDVLLNLLYVNSNSIVNEFNEIRQGYIKKDNIDDSLKFNTSVINFNFIDNRITFQGEIYQVPKFNGRKKRYNKNIIDFPMINIYGSYLSNSFYLSFAEDKITSKTNLPFTQLDLQYMYLLLKKKLTNSDFSKSDKRQLVIISTLLGL